jgi:integrase/recombinase XerD
MGPDRDSTLEVWIENYLHWLREEKGRTARTIDAYRFELDRFRGYLAKHGVKDSSQVDREDIRDLLSKLGQTNGPKARTRTLSVLRSWYAYLLREGCVIQDPTSGIDFPRIQRKDPAPLSERQIKHLLSVLSQYATKGSLLRDRAILLLFLGTGIRLSGLVNLNREDVDLEEQVIRVHRKGGKEEIVELNSIVADALGRYDETQPVDRKAFFLSTRRKRISRDAVYRLVKKYLFFADLEGSPHTFRATCITELSRKGVPLSVIQRIVGHEDPKTTAGYTKVYAEDRRKAVESLDLE